MVNVKPLSNAEYEIMCLLWKEGRSLTAHEILEKMSEKSWKVETLLTFLSRLQGKGAISAEKVPTAGRRAHSLFSCTLTKDEYKQLQNRALVDKFYDGDAEGLLESLLADGSLTKDILKKHI